MDDKYQPDAISEKREENTLETVESQQGRHAHVEHLAGKDKAAEFLESVGQTIVVSPADNARILRKIDLTILPIMLAVYFLQALDKATLSYASVFGLVDNAHLGGQDYSWLGSIVVSTDILLPKPYRVYQLISINIVYCTIGPPTHHCLLLGQASDWQIRCCNGVVLGYCLELHDCGKELQDTACHSILSWCI